VATNRRWKSPDGEEMSATDWFNVECWNGLAEVVDTYQRKGRRVFVEGRLQIDHYEKDGQQLQYVKIVASNIIFLDRPDEAVESQESDAEPIPF
jgi:single-strand DNA-binding protein